VIFSLVVRIDSPFQYDVEKSSGEFISGMSNSQKCFSDQVKVIMKGKQIIGSPHRAALLTSGGTGISSSDFLALLNKE
jgi:molybdopterin biosynthesis enzyme MoaB